MKRMITTVEELMIPAGTVHITLPLIISLFEYVRTNPNITNADVMMISEKIASKSRGSILTVEDFESIVGSPPETTYDESLMGNVWCDGPDGNVTPLTSGLSG